jgi:DNA polymerase sigma
MALSSCEEQLLSKFGPSAASETKRRAVINLVKSGIRSAFLPYVVPIDEYGSFPLKTYIIDSDIDLTVIVPKEYDSISTLERI